MEAQEQEPWGLDASADQLRLYAVTQGRTVATRPLDLASLLQARPEATGRGLTSEHQRILALCCGGPLSIAELSGVCRQPVTVIKILVSDLIEAGALVHTAPAAADSVEPQLLERVLDGLRALKY